MRKVVYKMDGRELRDPIEADEYHHFQLPSFYHFGYLKLASKFPSVHYLKLKIESTKLGHLRLTPTKTNDNTVKMDILLYRLRFFSAVTFVHKFRELITNIK